MPINNPGGSGGAWTLIATATPNAAATVTFSSIAAGYKAFKIVALIKPTAIFALFMTFNNDSTAANYKHMYTYTDGTLTYDSFSAGATATTFNLPFDVPAALEILINNIAAQVKTVVGISCAPATTSGMGQSGGSWSNTSVEINRIDLTTSASTFANGTRILLYGLV